MFRTVQCTATEDAGQEDRFRFIFEIFGLAGSPYQSVVDSWCFPDLQKSCQVPAHRERHRAQEVCKVDQIPCHGGRLMLTADQQR